jgi:hypothetical protein
LISSFTLDKSAQHHRPVCDRAIWALFYFLLAVDAWYRPSHTSLSPLDLPAHRSRPCLPFAARDRPPDAGAGARAAAAVLAAGVEAVPVERRLDGGGGGSRARDHDAHGCCRGYASHRVAASAFSPDPFGSLCRSHPKSSRDPGLTRFHHEAESLSYCSPFERIGSGPASRSHAEG